MGFFKYTYYNMKIKVINEKFSVKNSSIIANDYNTCMCSAYNVIKCTYQCLNVREQFLHREKATLKAQLPLYLIM